MLDVYFDLCLRFRVHTAVYYGVPTRGTSVHSDQRQRILILALYSETMGYVVWLRGSPRTLLYCLLWPTSLAERTYLIIEFHNTYTGVPPPHKHWMNRSGKFTCAMG